MPDTSLTDPLGRVVVLHERTWYGHILKGHSDMEGLRALVELAITSPIAIWTSRSSSDCRLYYGNGPRPGIMVMVVADVVIGRVKTAHFARKITGGREEWLSPTP